MKKRTFFMLFWALMFAGAFFILCQSGYSDGDDAYFYQYTHSMGFLEYLGWRYETWVGRVAAEALVYLTFHMGLWFWRIINAGMLVLLPMGILRLACRAARIPEGTIRNWQERMPVSPSGDYREFGYGIPFAAVSGYLLMGAMTLGYAAVWVNGSIFYTWTFTCGIYALIPLADLVFTDENVDWKKFIYSIPCGIIASMSIEQMGAVLLVFEVLGLAYGTYRRKNVNILMLIQTGVTLAAFIVLFLAPGNEIRVAAEIATWLPEYDTMSLGQHLFITVQWLLTSFANENRLFLCGIWIVGILLLLEHKAEHRRVYGYITTAVIFSVVSLLPFAGITVLSDMGMNIADITVKILEVPAAESLTVIQIIAMIWWTVALVFTFIFLSKISGFQVTLLLAYLAGIASEAIMYFSPTMYASGARVYYLTDILYLFIMLCLSMELKETKRRNIYYGILAVLGIGNFLFQLPVFLKAM